MEEKKKSDWLLPASILTAAILISVSLVYSAGREGNADTANLAGSENQNAAVPSVENLKPVSSKDHIMGDPDAPVKIVEFSDTECPYCKTFHVMLEQVVKDYDGKVAWVYRHFPLDSIHSKVRLEAAATECAAELGGNDRFWSYIGKLLEITPSNDGLDLALLPQIAGDVGLDVTAFQSCLESGKYADKIEADLQDGILAGGRGTPYSVVIAPNGRKFAISGAQPLANIELIIDQALEL